MLQTCFVPGGNPIYPYMKGDVHVDASDQEKINVSLLMLLGTFFFITFVLKLSKWKLTPMLGSILVMSFFVWAGKQLYEDFTRNSASQDPLCLKSDGLACGHLIPN